jgi:hypothetical protein
MRENLPMEHLADSGCIVTRLLHAQQVPSEMTWYVTQFPRVAAPQAPEAPSQSLLWKQSTLKDNTDCFRNSSTGKQRSWVLYVFLECEVYPTTTPPHLPLAEAIADILRRATHHTQAAYSSLRSTSQPTILSSPRKSTSPPVSTTQISTQMAASAWISCETSGALL